jgi:PP-loop superfamily ATP-utilizing enzyme
MEDEQRGFKITDKRKSAIDNDRFSSQDKTDERTCEEIAQEEAFTTVLNFSTFILSLTTSALVCLGELPDPITKEKTLNLPLAQQTISIIEVLKEKTAGNLSEDEDNLIGTVLYDLRMKYVQSACS